MARELLYAFPPLEWTLAALARVGAPSGSRVGSRGGLGRLLFSTSILGTCLRPGICWVRWAVASFTPGRRAWTCKFACERVDSGAGGLTSGVVTAT